MREICHAIEGGVLLGCMWALFALAAGVAIYHLTAGWRIWRSKRHRAAVSALAMVAIIVGGTKPPGLICTWDDGFALRSAVADTNDLRIASFAWRVMPYVPPTATATLSAIELHTYNPDPEVNRLFTVATVPMTNCALRAIMPLGATNYMYWMECSYIPDAPVVTNGVYHLRCVGGRDIWVPLGVEIYREAELISPPSESFINDLMKGNLQ